MFGPIDPPYESPDPDVSSNPLPEFADQLQLIISQSAKSVHLLAKYVQTSLFRSLSVSISLISKC